MLTLHSNWVKLGDGALMSDFYPECYHIVHGAQRPVRWSTLETLQGGLCTLPSNVVSILHVFTVMCIMYKSVVMKDSCVLLHDMPV